MRSRQRRDGGEAKEGRVPSFQLFLLFEKNEDWKKWCPGPKVCEHPNGSKPNLKRFHKGLAGTTSKNYSVRWKDHLPYYVAGDKGYDSGEIHLWLKNHRVKDDIAWINGK